MQGPTILSQYPWVSQGVTCVDEFTVAYASPAPYGNTKEILVYNTSDTIPVFIRAVSTKIEQASISIILVPTAVSFIFPGDALVFDPGGLSLTLTCVAGPPGANQFEWDPGLNPTTQANHIRDAINLNWAGIVLATTEVYTDNGYTYRVVRCRIAAAFQVGDASNGYGIQITNALTIPGIGNPWTVSPGDFSVLNVQTGFSAGGVGSVIGPADLTIANALYLPPLSAITLAVGVEGERNDLAGPNSPAGLQVAFLCGTGGTNVSLSVTYVQASGGGGTGQRTGLGG